MSDRTFLDPHLDKADWHKAGCASLHLMYAGHSSGQPCDCGGEANKQAIIDAVRERLEKALETGQEELEGCDTHLGDLEVWRTVAYNLMRRETVEDDK